MRQAGHDNNLEPGIFAVDEQGCARPAAVTRRYDAILFDLLTALLDSWSLWNAVAGSEADGGRWRGAYLALTYRTGRYRPYEALVAESAEAVGLPRRLADDLAARYGDIRPWPEAAEVLGALHAAGIPLGVVTNCSEMLGRRAVKPRCRFRSALLSRPSVPGYYKPDPLPYRLALDELGRRSRSAACSSPARPMTCSAPPASVCRPGGMTASA